MERGSIRTGLDVIRGEHPSLVTHAAPVRGGCRPNAGRDGTRLGLVPVAAIGRSRGTLSASGTRRPAADNAVPRAVLGADKRSERGEIVSLPTYRPRCGPRVARAHDRLCSAAWSARCAVIVWKMSDAWPAVSVTSGSAPSSAARRRRWPGLIGCSRHVASDSVRLFSLELAKT